MENFLLALIVIVILLIILAFFIGLINYIINAVDDTKEDEFEEYDSTPYNEEDYR